MTTRMTDTTTTGVPARTGSAWGGAVIAGIVSVIVNLIVTYVIWMFIPPAQATDLGYLLTMVGIMSFFAGLFSYNGGFKQALGM